MNPNELIEAIGKVTNPAFTAALQPPEYVDDEDPNVRTGPWAIENIGTLDWALGRIAAKKAERSHIEAQRDDAITRIKGRADSIIASINHGIGFLEAHAARFATANRELLLGGTGKKSRVFLHGTIGWRKRAGRLVVVDEVALGTWLRQQDNLSLFRIKVEPSMKELQENYAANGAVPPGMEYVLDQEKLHIDVVDPTAPLAKGKP